MQKNIAHAMLVAAALMGALGLFRFARFISGRAGPNLASATVHHELLAIYAPATLIEFAKNQNSIATSAELTRLIEMAGLRNCWFVIEQRATQQDGTVSQMSLIIRFDQDESQFHRNQGILQTLAGKPPDDYHAGAQIVVIPENLQAKEPLEVLNEVLGL